VDVAMGNSGTWRLSRTYASSGGDVAYDVVGSGPPVVLVHGTPSWSYLWRDVAARLSGDFTVYVHDLLGYGTSSQHEGQDVSIPTQARVLEELLDLWGLEEPCVAGHDIGAAVALRLVVLNQRRFRRLALSDAVAFAPWITPFSRHVQRYLEAFQTMPEHIHRQLVAAHLRTALAQPTTDEELAPYLTPWTGRSGQAAYYRQVAQFDETHTREIEPEYRTIDIPTLVLWGDQDAWLPPSAGRRLADTLPRARLALVPDAGHFLPEEQPETVAVALATFFGEERWCNWPADWFASSGPRVSRHWPGPAARRYRSRTPRPGRRGRRR
jgi:pimeloyl-ACP methyl ester carboxylesterase